MGLDSKYSNLVVACLAVVAAFALPYTVHRQYGIARTQVSDFLEGTLESARMLLATKKNDLSSYIAVKHAIVEPLSMQPFPAHAYTTTCVFDDILENGFDRSNDLHTTAVKALNARHHTSHIFQERIADPRLPVTLLSTMRHVIGAIPTPDMICSREDAWCRNPGITRCNAYEIALLMTTTIKDESIGETRLPLEREYNSLREYLYHRSTNAFTFAKSVHELCATWSTRCLLTNLMAAHSNITNKM